MSVCVNHELYIGKLHQGANFGREGFDKEYKEIVLKDISKYFNKDEIKGFLVYNSKLNYSKFNRMIQEILKEYFNSYLPKYISIFSNARISGNMYFGISDCGIIEGFPWHGKLTNKIIKKLIKSVIESNHSRGIRIDDFDENMIHVDDSVLNWYYDNLEISIIKLKI